MRQPHFVIILALLLGATGTTGAQTMPAANKENAEKSVEVTADKSLEWYQKERVYVARGNAKAVRGDMTVESDLLTAHEREKTAATPAKPKTAGKGTGDIDKMTAEGNVRIYDQRQRVTGDRAIYDLDQEVILVTGNNLKYRTDKETVTARDSLEYHEAKKIAVARGRAVAEGTDRHVEGDTLTAEFRDTPAGQQELYKMTANGNVTVITHGNISRGNRAVYDVARNIAVLSGNVRVTRTDGLQLSGDVAEVDFASGQSRLMNDGKGQGRVRALLGSKPSSPAAKAKPASAKAP